MSDLIREDILQKLVRIAEAQHRDINDFLSDVVTMYDFVDQPQSEEVVESEDTLEEIPPANTLAGLAAIAEKLNLQGTGRITSQNIREVLNTEYAEYLEERLKRDENDDSR
jgi:hypothetical protein